jgi:hypothetical protein
LTCLWNINSHRILRLYGCWRVVLIFSVTLLTNFFCGHIKHKVIKFIICISRLNYMRSSSLFWLRIGLSFRLFRHNMNEFIILKWCILLNEGADCFWEAYFVI